MTKGTLDFTVTIKNIPSKEIMDTWEDAIKQYIKHFGEVAEFSNNICIDFNDAMEISPEGFYEIISHAMSLHIVKTGVKVVKE